MPIRKLVIINHQAATLIAVAVACLAACAPGPIWEKAGASQAELDADMELCRAEVQRVPNTFGNLRKPVIVRRSCMEARGWYSGRQSGSSGAVRMPKQDYRECNNEAERQTGTRNIFDVSYKEAYERCMRAGPG